MISAALVSRTSASVSASHTGEATVGYIGSERRSEYTAIGDTVNLSQRREANAKAAQILVSDETRGAAGRVLYALQAGPAIVVKNRHRPVQIFQMEWQRADTGGAARPDTNS